MSQDAEVALEVADQGFPVRSLGVLRGSQLPDQHTPFILHFELQFIIFAF